MNRPPLVRLVLLVTAVAAGALLLAGCGGDDDSAADTAATQAVPFDRAFIDAMVPHHEEAIAMAGDAKDAGLSEPVLVDVADAILETQQAEIDRMREWREQWFGSSEIDPEGADGLGMSAEEMGMSDTGIDFSSEPDVDGAFASMMIAHHEGAIEMASTEISAGENAEAIALAQRIVEAQRAEIDQMRDMLRS